MDNSLLLINCDKIEELVLLDEACDEVEALINFKNISMIQLPLAKIECDIKRSLSETDDT